MSEKLITLKTALLAKEKGFDVQTYGKCWVKTLDGDIIHNSDRKNIEEHDRCEQYLMQPSQTVLQKWLRENHNIQLYVYSHTLKNGKYGDYIICINGKDFNDPRDEDYQVYEDAMEVGLYESLKLVKK